MAVLMIDSMAACADRSGRATIRGAPTPENFERPILMVAALARTARGIINGSALPIFGNSTHAMISSPG